MKRFLRILTSVLSVVILTFTVCACSSKNKEFILPSRTLIEGETKYFGSYEYSEYDDGSVAITNYTGSETNLTIPATLDGKTVTAIGNAAFSGNTMLVSVRLPDSLEEIGEYAFLRCSALSSIEFGEKLWSVGIAAFEETPWLAARTDDWVIIGDSLLILYQGNETDITVPDGVRHISGAFAGNEEIINVEMSDGVFTVGESAFAGCLALRRVQLSSELRLIGNGAFDGCEGLSSMEIPDKVEAIGEYAFNYCSFLSTVRVGNSVKSIGKYAFRGCMRILTMTLPESLENVGFEAFADLYSLSLVVYEGSEAGFAELELDGTNYILSDTPKVYLK